jgi:NAD+ synthase
MSQEPSVLDDTAPLDLRLSQAELEATRDHVVSFVRSVVDDAGAAGAVIGLSGGVDSSTTAAAAVEALGADGVHGLVMPSEVNTDENMSDAERVAESLDVEYDVIDINPIADAVFDAYPAADDDRIVLGTGNRSEALTGYFTKYGDQAVDCNPIGNLYKQQVRQLGAALGLPRDLVMKTPSAEMWLGQTDEAELGLDYDTLDAVLALHVDGPLSKAATVRELDVDREVVDRVVDLHERSAHKRRMPPAPDPLHL